MMSASRLTAITVGVAVAAVLVACTEDIEPRNPGGAIPGDEHGFSNSGGDDATDDDIDVSNDDGGDFSCGLIPDDDPADDRYPCCFSDLDCQQSGVEQAEHMFCYYSDCHTGVQGVCRIGPDFIDDCWDDLDCPIGETCPYEEEADLFDCQKPTVVEAPSLCIPE